METRNWDKEVSREDVVVEEERFEVKEANEVWDLVGERVSFEVEDSEKGKRKVRKNVGNEVREKKN